MFPARPFSVVLHVKAVLWVLHDLHGGNRPQQHGCDQSAAQNHHSRHAVSASSQK
jgi:hypothetical protein